MEQEVELAQAHEREGVGRDDDVGVRRDAEDRRDRVEREQEAGDRYGDHDEQQRGAQAATVDRARRGATRGTPSSGSTRRTARKARRLGDVLRLVAGAARSRPTAVQMSIAPKR